MNNLASMLNRQGKYEHAGAIYRQAHEPREKEVLGKDHPSTLTKVNNLAFELGDQGKYKWVEEMHRQGTQAEGNGAGQSASIQRRA
jgi:Tetratricopeptide repeat